MLDNERLDAGVRRDKVLYGLATVSCDGQLDMDSSPADSSIPPLLPLQSVFVAGTVANRFKRDDVLDADEPSVAGVRRDEVL